MREFLVQPWPWYITGPVIGIMVPLLLILGNKSFGISSTMRHICAACIPVKLKFFNYDWKKEMWSLVFSIGIVIGGFLAGSVFNDPLPVDISAQTKDELMQMGVNEFSTLAPLDIFSWNNLFTLKGFLMIAAGGFLVGFGTRYANGCTSGHSIMGLSMLNLGSLVATIGFFMGGLIATHFLLPLLFSI